MFKLYLLIIIFIIITFLLYLIPNLLLDKISSKSKSEDFDSQNKSLQGVPIIPYNAILRNPISGTVWSSLPPNEISGMRWIL